MSDDHNQTMESQAIYEPWKPQTPAAETTMLQCSELPSNLSTGMIKIKESR